MTIFKIKSIEKRESVFDGDIINKRISELNFSGLYYQLQNPNRVTYKKEDFNLNLVSEIFEDMFYGKTKTN